jgi:hypothetical protein
MNLILQQVDTNYVAQIWPLVEKYLVDALVDGVEKQNIEANYNIHHVQSFLTTGMWLLIVATDEEGVIHGASTISFANYPMARVAFITLTGGKLIANREIFEQLKTILKQRGATKVQAYCRESMVRLLGRTGFKPITTLVEAQI